MAYYYDKPDYKLNVQVWDPKREDFLSVAKWVNMCQNVTQRGQMMQVEERCDVHVRTELPSRSATAIKITPMFFEKKQPRSENDKVELWSLKDNNTS